MQFTHRLGESNILICRNLCDREGNPAGGYAHGPGMTIAWQDGPRGKNPDGSLAPANGAFVEDALAAAHERLSFFQSSKFMHADNAEAIAHIQLAIDALSRRAKARAARGVLGQNVV